MAYRQRSGNGCLSVFILGFFILPCLVLCNSSEREHAPAMTTPAPQRIAPPQPPDPRIELGRQLRTIGEAACQGRATSTAAVYRRDVVGVHAAIVFPSTPTTFPGNHGAWAPSTAEAAELAVCMDDVRERVVQVCRYVNAPSITRYRYDRRVRLVEISTGRTLATRLIRGASPRRCGSSERYDLTALYGDEPVTAAALDTFASWIQR